MLAAKSLTAKQQTSITDRHSQSVPPFGNPQGAPHVMGAAHAMTRNLGNTMRQSVPQVQRKCACGGAAKSTGECDECRRKRLHAPQGAIQRTLQVGPVNDPYERAADRVADTIMRMPIVPTSVGAAPHTGEGSSAQPLSLAPRIQRQSNELKGGGEADEWLRRKALTADAGGIVSQGLATQIQTMRSGGQPLSPVAQQFFGSRMGQDFSQVRIHTGARAGGAAQALQARAFTLGSDIFFNRSEYAPDTATGRRLLAHELTHVVQQTGGAALPDGGVGPLQRSPTVGMIQRAVSPQLDEIESLLSYGVFDWAIRDAEAIRALDLLKSLPRFQQATFFANRKYVNRLRENLPDTRVQELTELERAVGPIQPNNNTVESIREKLSYGLFDWVITDAEAIAALEMLKQLSGTELAVALAAINYSRLLDNLPDARKQELIDLLAQGLGTGGARQQEENQNPGTILNSITFTSDHGVMKDQTENWSNSGALYGQPEWSVANGKVQSQPVSQTKNTNVAIDVGLNILPESAPTAPIKLVGRSDAGFLNFNYTGTLHGGLNQTLSMTSTGKLPDRVAVLPDQRINWTMEWRNWKHDIGQTGGHTFFVTIDTPLAPTEVTYKRMALAAGLIQRVYTDNTHELVRRIMQNWGYYDLDIQYANAWELADNLEAGAQCIDIVRFVNGLLQTVGAPGTATAVVVWAHPDSPTTPVEQLWLSAGGKGLHTVGDRMMNGKQVFVGLMDANGCPNAYEAALRFNDGSSTKYYPGGVSMDQAYLTPADVLHVFQCLAWLEPLASKQFRIERIAATYPNGSCTAGAVIRCH